MGYQTYNIDRIAKEGMMFTDAYGEQSCTAGRSSFITGQSVYRTGLSKVGIPGAPVAYYWTQFLKYGLTQFGPSKNIIEIFYKGFY
jgi:arylsulfatase A-like enzyme